MTGTDKKFHLRSFSKWTVIAALFGAFLAMDLGAMAETVVYSESFNHDNGGYVTAGLGDWKWGSPDFDGGPDSSPGDNLWGTNTDGGVPDDTSEYLLSPAIPIPAVTDQKVYLRFFAWIAVDEEYDKGIVAVSKNGADWTILTTLYDVMQGGWNEYYFDVTEFAGSSLYIQFGIQTDASDDFHFYPYNMAGLYVDDVQILVYDPPQKRTILTLEAFESDPLESSCPWIFPWNGDSFQKDNDVYSTARGSAKEYRDYYMLGKSLVKEDGHYRLDLRETESEQSYTDWVQLLAVDHAAAVKVGVDDEGGVWTYQAPQSPQSAVDGLDQDVLAKIAAEDDDGFHAYNNSTMVLDFGNLDISEGATLVLRAKGFQTAGPQGDPTFATPLIQIQTKDGEGNWVTRHLFYPRWEWAVGAYDLSADLANGSQVRLAIASCHTGKFHVIDYVGLDTSAQAARTVHPLSPTEALRSPGDLSVLDRLLVADDDYAQMTPGQGIAMTFDAPALSGDERDFVFASEGYYVPGGTFFIMTWNGDSWVTRTGRAFDANDETFAFDMSPFLPDPDGEFKVKIWQDYRYEPAGIDFVGLTYDNDAGTMDYAHDTFYDASVYDATVASDNVYDEWNDTDNSPRIRYVEVRWVDLPTLSAPTTDPVTISDPVDPTPSIQWTYDDGTKTAQSAFEVEVWTARHGTGDLMWDPAPVSGSASSVVYKGSALQTGETYFARVKAFDGTLWGLWSEASWEFTGVTVTDAGMDAAADSGADADADGDADTDADGDADGAALGDAGDAGADAGGEGKGGSSCSCQVVGQDRTATSSVLDLLWLVLN